MKKLLYISIPLIVLAAIVFVPLFEKEGLGEILTKIKSLPASLFQREGQPAEAAGLRNGLVGWWTMDANDKLEIKNPVETGFLVWSQGELNPSARMLSTSSSP